LIERQQLKIIRRHGCNQGEHDIGPRFRRRQKLGAGRFVQSADSPPQVNLPRGIHVPANNRAPRARGRRQVAGDILSAAAKSCVIQLRKEFRVRLRGEGLRLLDPRYGDPQIVIVRQRLANQPLQRLVVKNTPPRKIGDGVG